MNPKKILALVLSLAMILSTMSVTGFAQTEELSVPLPTATVTRIASPEGTPLTFALNFSADAATEEQKTTYDEWFADFVLTINKDVTFNANGDADGYLAGEYGEYGWISVPFEDVTLSSGEPFRIMEYAYEEFNQDVMKVPYKYVRDPEIMPTGFSCGLYLDDEFLQNNPDMELKLELRLYPTFESEESYLIGESKTFTCEDALANGVIKVNGVTYPSVEDAFVAIGDGAEIELVSDITFESSVEIANDLTIDLNGNAISNTSAVSLFSESGDALITVDGADIEIKDTSADKTGKIITDSTELFAVENGGSITVYGGNFSHDVSAYAADGYTGTKTADGYYTVVYGEPVAKVGNVTYVNIDDAINAWTAGTTLTLLSDVVLSDVVSFNSTDHHTLNLGEYTITAASGKNAFEIIPKGVGTAARPCFTINADETKPGGITAAGKACIYYNNANKIADRLTVTINGGVFDGGYAINATSGPLNKFGFCTSPLRGQGAPYFVLNGGTFNAQVFINAGMLKATGGIHHKNLTCMGDSTAYRLISGGTYKGLTLTADGDGKTVFGTDGNNKADFNVGMYVNSDGYLVVGGPVISETDGSFDAWTSKYSSFSSYLKYSSAATNGLYYSDIATAFSKVGTGTIKLLKSVDADVKTSGNTILDITDANADFNGTITLGGSSHTLTLVTDDKEFNGEIIAYSGQVLTKSYDADGNVVYASIKDDGLAAVLDNEYKYATVNAAIEAARDNGTVKLLRDVEEDVIFPAQASNFGGISLLSVEQGVLLDLDGNTLTGTITVNDGAVVALQNGTINNTDETKNAITSEGILTISEVDLTSAGNGVVALGGETKVLSGTYNVPDGKEVATSTASSSLLLTGGTYSSNVDMHAAEGYVGTQNEYGQYTVVADDSGNNKTVAKAVNVSLEQVAENKYNLVLEADSSASEIHRFLSAELNIKLATSDGSTVDIYSIDGNSAYGIEVIDPLYNDSGVWGFHLNDEAKNYTGNKLTIATITLTGYGKAALSVEAHNNNKVEAIESIDGNIVKKYVADDSTLVLPAEASKVEIKVPTKKLTIKVTFPNAIAESEKAYQNMHVNVSGKDIEDIDYDLGSDGDFSLNADGQYVIEIADALTLNNSYNITLTGAGYRTAKYRVTMTDDKTVYFWNDAVKGEAIAFEEGGKVKAKTSFLAGDIAEDNIIDKYDLAAVVSYFGKYGLKADAELYKYAKYDLNRDGKIDSEDIAYVLASFGY